MNLGIIGSGGFARETLLLSKTINNNNISKFDDIFFVEFDDYYKHEMIDETKVLKLSSCDFSNFRFVIAIADNKIREKISIQLGNQVKYTSLVSPNSFLSSDIIHSDGLIVMPYSYITCNVKLGKHAQLNTSCSIGHDTEIGDFLTMVSGSRVAGNNLIGDRVYFAANSSTKQGLRISGDTKIGLNSAVVKDIDRPGTYFGIPAKFLSR